MTALVFGEYYHTPAGRRIASYLLPHRKCHIVAESRVNLLFVYRKYHALLV